MFNVLLETRTRPERRGVGGTIASVLVHAAVIVGAVVATARGSTPPDAAKPGTVVFVPSPPDVPRPATATATPTTSDWRPAPVVIPPVEVPVFIPEFVVGAPLDPTTIFAPGGPSPGTPGRGDPTGAPALGQPWIAALVETPALALPGAPLPAYPDILRRSGVEGEVVAQFVVDTLGRVEAGSFIAIRTTHPLFAASVERVVTRLHFFAAEAGGRRVRQLVQQPFVFAIER